MNSTNAIEIRNMYKDFKVQYDKANTLKDYIIRLGGSKKEKHHVLKDINIDIKKGDTVALIGVNGSGKSTLLKLMTKIIYPTSGTIDTSGKLTSLLELGAGFHPDFTGRENIYFNAAIFGLNEQEINKRIDSIIEFSELESAIDEPIRTYSSGMYMRLAFSIAINVDADILLIDEILAVGDQHFQDKCFAKLKELKKSDKTIVIVSHSLNTVKDLCTRAIWIYNGRVREDGDPTFVINKYLEQVAKDHKEEKKKALESGKDKYRGVVAIDAPKNYQHVSIDRSNFRIAGWAISDCENAKLVVSIGEKDLEKIDFFARQDIYDMYYEDYIGFLEPSTIGWGVHVNVSDYVSERRNNELEIKAQIQDELGNIISEKSVIVLIDEVEE